MIVRGFVKTLTGAYIIKLFKGIIKLEFQSLSITATLVYYLRACLETYP
jgi:hypothetical protein